MYIARLPKGLHRAVDKPSLSRRLFCFDDAVYATHTDGKSHSDYCFGMNEDPGMFFSKSSKQKGVTLSSTEAEIWAAVETAKEVIWFRDLLNELGLRQKGPTTIFADNSLLHVSIGYPILDTSIGYPIYVFVFNIIFIVLLFFHR